MNDSSEDDPWLDPDLAERLLDGKEIADPDPRTAELAQLLAAADGTRAGRPDEERAALRAFTHEFWQAQASARTRRGTPGRGVRRRARGSRSAKVMIGGAAVVLALGGVAIAVQTGALPHPFRSASTASAPRPSTATHAVPRAPESPPGAVGAPPPTHTAAGVHSAPTSSTRPSSSSAHTTGAPAVPGLKGLCESYVKAARQGRKLDVPSQARLEQAAGGASEVDAYCARLTGATVVHGGSSAASSQASSSPAAKATALRSSGHGQARTRPLS